MIRYKSESISMTKELKAKILKLAKKRKMTFSEIIRETMEDRISKQEET